MKILFLGDIVGKRGREVIRDLLSSLKEKYKPDFIIANAENAAHGKGLTFKLYNELLSYGIDAMTMGNHTYSKREIYDHIDSMDKLIVPYNINDRVGEGYRIFEVNGKKICLCNLLGQVMMGEYMSNPFEAYNEILDKTKADIYFVDFHGEATAEKRLFVEYFKDDIDVCVGTHTHIQTADEDILYEKIAFISDVGMCGPYYSIIGRNIEESMKAYLGQEKTHYETCETDPILCGVLIDFNSINVPNDIIRIQIRP